MWMLARIHACMQIILSVGTKLQGIICRMAIDITERHAVIQGIPLVQVSDSYFWFSRPTFVLFLIHFTLFQVRLIDCSAFLARLIIDH